MADEGFQVVFRGELVGDRPEEAVKQQLAALFRMPGDKVEALFTGKPVVVKRNLDEATARKFEAAFRKAGAVCELRGPAGESSGPSAGEGETGGKAEGAASEPAPGPTSAAGASGGRTRDATTAAGDPNRTVLDLEVPASLEGLELDESEAPLAPPDDKPSPEIDTSELGLAEPGGNLTEPKRPTPPNIDTSDLSLEDADT